MVVRGRNDGVVAVSDGAECFLGHIGNERRLRRKVEGSRRIAAVHAALL